MRKSLGRLLVLLVLSIPMTARVAALGARLSFAEIVQDGETIVAATITSVSTRWGAEHKMIWTDYALSVQEVWKGSPRAVLTVSFAGGTVAGESILVSHVPELEVGATYVLSLHEPGHLYASPVVGSEQGLFREVTDAESGRRILLDAEGFAVRLGADGQIVRIAAAEPALTSGKVTLRRTSLTGVRPPSIADPTYRDGQGRLLPAPTSQPSRAARTSAAAQESGFPLTRAALKAAVRQVVEGRREGDGR